MAGGPFYVRPGYKYRPEVQHMTFTFKLAKRLAQSWYTSAVPIAASCLPLSSEHTAPLVVVSPCLSIRSIWALGVAH